MLFGTNSNFYIVHITYNQNVNKRVCLQIWVLLKCVFCVSWFLLWENRVFWPDCEDFFVSEFWTCMKLIHLFRISILIPHPAYKLKFPYYIPYFKYQISFQLWHEEQLSGTSNSSNGIVHAVVLSNSNSIFAWHSDNSLVPTFPINKRRRPQKCLKWQYLNIVHNVTNGEYKCKNIYCTYLVEKSIQITPNKFSRTLLCSK